jgi:hypothetical protein
VERSRLQTKEGKAWTPLDERYIKSSVGLARIPRSSFDSTLTITDFTDYNVRPFASQCVSPQPLNHIEGGARFDVNSATRNLAEAAEEDQTVE